MTQGVKKNIVVVIVIAGVALVVIGYLAVSQMLPDRIISGAQNNERIPDRLPGSFQFFTDAKHESFSTDDVATSESGIVISGNVVVSDKYRIPEDADNYVVQIKLAIAEPESLPIGWGHQFGDVVLTTADDCYDVAFDFSDEEKKQCRTWYHKQLEQQDIIRRQFMRQWEVTLPLSKSVPPGLSQMTFGPSAWPELRHYSITIPWSELPPVKNGLLEKLLLSIILPYPSRNEVHEDTTLYLDGLVVYAGTEYRELILPTPTSFVATECDLPPIAYDFFFNKSSTSYVVPMDKRRSKEVFMIDIPRHGYQYSPEEASPMLHQTNYFDRKIGNEIVVCGPNLTAVNLHTGEKILSDIFLARPSYRGDMIQIRRLSEDVYLAVAGPYEFSSFYGSGQCGACPRYGVGVYKIDFGKKIILPLFSDEEMSDPGSYEVSYHVSPDMNKITVSLAETVYGDEAEETTWTTTTYCLDDDVTSYEVCGKTSELGKQ